MAGGITSGVTYLGIEPGGSVPPGTCASACRMANCHGNTSEAPVSVPAARNCRLETRILIPPCSLGAYGYCQPTMGSGSIGGPRAAGSDQFGAGAAGSKQVSTTVPGPCHSWLGESAATASGSTAPGSPPRLGGGTKKSHKT